MSKKADLLAFDRGTVRRISVDGYLHVEITPISKAVVNPYLGNEIPGFEELGLDAGKIYYLLRDPEELKKSASTFNNLPLLLAHKPVLATNPPKDLIVGSTGTDAKFTAPYLTNSLVVWDAAAIAGIESDEQKELSCSYRYKPDMTPGTYEGVAYDGRMTNIIGNHVALVEIGRAGHDVVVNDANPFVSLEKFDMKKTSRAAIAAKAGIGAYLLPHLAADAAIDLAKLIGLPKKATAAADATRIAQSVMAGVTGKLAADAKIDDKHLARIVRLALDSESDADMPADPAEDEDQKREGESDEEYEARMKAKREGGSSASNANDSKQAGIDKAAMDAAIVAAARDAEQRTIARMTAIRTAEEEVRPLLGAIAAQDSADAVYKLALDHLKVDLTGVPKEAYRAMAKLAMTKGQPTNQRVNLANDSGSDSVAFAKAFNLKK